MAVVLNLKYYWYFIFAGVYGLIEELFLALGIYSHNWYETWMTVILLPLAFWIAKIMYAKIIQGVKPISHYIFVYLGLFPLYIISFNWVLMLTRHLDFSTTLFSDPIISRFFVSLVLINLLAILSMLIYFLRVKWLWKAAVVVMMYTAYYIGYKLNLIWIKEGWFPFVSTASILWMYSSILIMNRLYKYPRYRRANEREFSQKH